MHEGVHHQLASCPLRWWLVWRGAACPLSLRATAQGFASEGDAGETRPHGHTDSWAWPPLALLHLLKENTGSEGPPTMGTVPASTSPRVQQEADSMPGVPLSAVLFKFIGIMHRSVSQSSLWPSRVTESCCAYSVAKWCVTGAAGPPQPARPVCSRPAGRFLAPGEGQLGPHLPTGVTNCPAPPRQGYLSTAPAGKPGATGTS